MVIFLGVLLNLTCGEVLTFRPPHADPQLKLFRLVNDESFQVGHEVVVLRELLLELVLHNFGLHFGGKSIIGVGYC